MTDKKLAFSQQKLLHVSKIEITKLFPQNDGVMAFADPTNSGQHEHLLQYTSFQRYKLNIINILLLHVSNTKIQNENKYPINVINYTTFDLHITFFLVLFKCLNNNYQQITFPHAIISNIKMIRVIPN